MYAGTAKWWLLALLPVFLLVGFGVYLADGGKEPRNRAKDQLRNNPKPVEVHGLTDENGQPFGGGRLDGQWTVLFFGYTSCPDVCPTSLGLLKKEYAALGELQDQVQVVFVSVDPSRDTQAKLREYVNYFHEDFHAVRGRKEAIDHLAEQLGAFYRRDKTTAEAGYTMSHSGDFYLLDPEGRWISYFRPPLKSGELASSLKQFAQQQPHS